jgi:hypothetical protein
MVSRPPAKGKNAHETWLLPIVAASLCPRPQVYAIKAGDCPQDDADAAAVSQHKYIIIELAQRAWHALYWAPEALCAATAMPMPQGRQAPGKGELP